MTVTLPEYSCAPVVEISPEISVVPLMVRFETFVTELKMDAFPVIVNRFPPPFTLVPETVTVEPVRVRSPPLRMRFPE